MKLFNLFKKHKQKYRSLSGKVFDTKEEAMKDNALYNKLSYDERRPLNKDKAINFLYQIENPRYKNVNREQGYATIYKDPVKTIGPGVAITSGIHPEWFDGRRVSLEDINNAAYEHLAKNDKVIRDNYDKIYGTKAIPHPADTINENARLFVAQSRYKNGNLVQTFPKIAAALARGDEKTLRTLIYNVNNSDVDRKRRLTEAMPIIYNK